MRCWADDPGGVTFGVYQYIPRFSPGGDSLAFSGGPRWFEDDTSDAGLDVGVVDLQSGYLRWSIVGGGDGYPPADGLDWSGDGGWMAYGCSKPGYGSGYSDLFVVDAVNHTEVAVTEAYHEVYGSPSFSPDATRLTFQMGLTSNSVSSGARAGIWTMSRAGSDRKYLGAGSSPAWCPR